MVELDKATNDEILKELWDRRKNRYFSDPRFSAYDVDYPTKYIAVYFRAHYTDWRNERYDELKQSGVM